MKNPVKRVGRARGKQFSNIFHKKQGAQAVVSEHLVGYQRTFGRKISVQLAGNTTNNW